MSQAPLIARLTPMRSFTLSLILLVLTCVLACGRGAPSPAAPATQAGEPPGASDEEAGDELSSPAPPPMAGSDPLRSEDELSQAEQALADADAELEALSDSQREQEPLGAGTKPKENGATRQADACTTTCRALASLTRARDSICRIEGASGERCARANTIVAKHAKSGQSCGCSE